MDGIQYLEAQHREVEALFEEARRTAPGRDKARAVGRIAETLMIHTTLEERYLYPEARRQGYEREASDCEAAHEAIKRLLARILETSQRDPALEGMLEGLADHVALHVQDEERRLFPHLRTDGSLIAGIVGTLEEASKELRGQDLLRAAENEGAMAEP